MSGATPRGARSIAAGLSPVGADFSLKGHTYAVLRAAIMDMDIYGEDVDLRLDERTLSEQLGISRTPIREALARLEQDGFVEIRARKGVYVRPKTLEEVLEMVVVWAALESMAARLVTESASDEDIASLRALGVGDGSRPDRADLAEYSEANVRFHQRILELSGCSLLKVTADNLLQHMHAVRRRAMAEGDRIRRSVVDHMGIIEAIEAREGDLAARLVREHTMKLHDHVRETWRELRLGGRDTPPDGVTAAPPIGTPAPSIRPERSGAHREDGAAAEEPTAIDEAPSRDRPTGDRRVVRRQRTRG